MKTLRQRSGSGAFWVRVTLGLLSFPAYSQVKDAPMPGMSASSQNQAPGPSAKPPDVEVLTDGSMIGRRYSTKGFAADPQAMPMSSMPPMDMSSMQGGKAPPDARSADYSEGHARSHMEGMDMSDDAKFSRLLLDQLEFAHDNHGDNAQFLDGEFWYGADFNKLWLKAEGESGNGSLQDLRTEALWDHAISAYWGAQVGVREDFGQGPSRTWAAFGVQGLAPYWFETEATLYVGESGRTAVRLQVEYDALLTQRLVLQPKVEAEFYGKEDPQRAIGSGLSSTELGVRVRYEIRREIAPYLGVIWRQRYGQTADLDRVQGEYTSELQLVVGLHVWY